MRGMNLVGLSALLFVGCAPTVTATSLVTASPKAPGEEVALYASKLPSCPFEELGLVNVQESSWGNSNRKLLEALKKQARRMGGDAVVGLGQHQVSSGGTIIGSTVVDGTETTFSGTVIRFTDPECRK